MHHSVVVGIVQVEKSKKRIVACTICTIWKATMNDKYASCIDEVISAHLAKTIQANYMHVATNNNAQTRYT